MKAHGVAFLTDDFAFDKERQTWVPNGSSFYRAFLPMSLLDGGIMGRPRFNPKEGFGINDGTEFGTFGFKTVSLKLTMEKWVIKQIERAKDIGQRIVIDVDDYYDGLHEDNIAHKATDPAMNPVRNRQHYARTLELADTLTVTTPFLLDYYRAKHPDVRMVRNGIVPEMFTDRPITTKKPVIGWLGATGWRSGDLETLRPWFPKFMEDHGLVFHHSGWHPSNPLAADIIGLNHLYCSIHKMMPIPMLNKLMLFDIGIVPLNDVPFNHAKSALKGMEYAAANIPFIAQALPEYEYLEQTGVGVTAYSPEEWVEQATRLLDAKERRRDAKANRDAVLDRWSFRHFRDEWREVYAD